MVSLARYLQTELPLAGFARQTRAIALRRGRTVEFAMPPISAPPISRQQ
jgi:hypothetical protein